MTLDDLEGRNRGFYAFFANFGLQVTIQERIAPKSIEIDMDKLHRKFSALNVDFDRLSLDYLGSSKPAHESIKERYSLESRYFTFVLQFFMKTVPDHHGHAAHHSKH